MYPVYWTRLSVRTGMQELLAFPEFTTASGISEFVAQLEELMGRMIPTSCEPTELNLYFVGNVARKTGESCRKTVERKSWTH